MDAVREVTANAEAEVFRGVPQMSTEVALATSVRLTLDALRSDRRHHQGRFQKSEREPMGARAAA
jgi:hypothetical protein